MQNDDDRETRHPAGQPSHGGRKRAPLVLNKSGNHASPRLPWALIPYHQVCARRVLGRRYSTEVEWALTAVALAPNLPVPIDPFLQQTFGEAFQRDPDPVLRWLGSVREEDARIKAVNPVRHYLLWHVKNIFDDADPVFADPGRMLRVVSGHYAVALPDRGIIERETTLIRNTLVKV